MCPSLTSPSNCHLAIFLQGLAAQTLMRRGSISVGPVSDLASLAAAPLGLLKWLKFNVQNEGFGWDGWDGRYAFLTTKLI